MKFLLLSFLFSLSGIAETGTIQCTAKVANRTYLVELNSSSREIKVDVDTGAKHLATANFYHSVIRNADIWAIPPAFNAQGLELVWDIHNQKHWVCLSASECYTCR